MKMVLGEFCEHILSSDLFTVVTKQYEDSTVAHLLSTKAQETKRREELFFNLQGARDLLKLMADMVHERDRLLHTMHSPKPSDDEDAVIDIFDTDDDTPDDVS